ncbi:MAG: FAD-dependent thymidylate synthase [Candidatus Sumerlaeaceae bacterium]|nr:FAD-dependent thymidylate synthase [Candidatus Sumerlaeaceae bacterium]
MQLPRVRLINIFSHAYDNFLATARTCYSSKGIIEPDALRVGSDLAADEAEKQIKRKRSLAKSIYEAGHHTTLQHAHVQFALEGVSRLFIWSFLHSHPFYNSEQVSQRYVAVAPESFYIPQKLSESGRRQFVAAVEARVRDYQLLCEILEQPASEDYFARFSGRRGTKRADLEIRRKAQEIARYVLPVAALAYMYHTVSVVTLLRYWRIVNEFDTPCEQRRVVEAMVRALLEHEPEFRHIIEDPLDPEELPEYGFFAQRPEYAFFTAQQRWEVDLVHAKRFIEEFDAELGGGTSRLVDFGSRNEQVLADAVREVLGMSRAELDDDAAIALVLDPAQNRLIGEALNLSMHSKLGRALFHARYTFRKKLSHAADSQDQRHRATPASRPILMRHYTGEPDYYLPPIVAQTPAALDVYERAMRDQWNAMNELLGGGEEPQAVAYLLPNAVNIRFTESADLFGLHHKMAMRLCYNSQEEIWRACLEEAEEISRVHPRIGRWLLPPCTLRKAAGKAPYCPEGERFCGVAVWRLERSDYQRVV